jgi:hypothetical protein
MDPPNPKLVHQVELRAEKIAKGDLVEVAADRVRKVDQPGGGYKWEEIFPDAPDDEPPAVKPPSKAELLELAKGFGIVVGAKPTVASLTEALDRHYAAAQAAADAAASTNNDD